MVNRPGREQVHAPAAYKAQQRDKPLPEQPLPWARKTVFRILEKVEHPGRMENSKTASKSRRGQKIEIHRKAAGIIGIANGLCEAGDGGGRWRKERKTA